MKASGIVRVNLGRLVYIKSSVPPHRTTKRIIIAKTPGKAKKNKEGRKEKKEINRNSAFPGHAMAGLKLAILVKVATAVFSKHIHWNNHSQGPDENVGPTIY